MSTASHTNGAARIGGIFSLACLAVTVTACSPPISAEEPSLNLGVLLENSTEFERSIIRDGVVTMAEYERALIAQRDCVSLAGATPGEIYEKGNNELTFDYDIVGPSRDATERIERNAEACLTEYFDDVGRVWSFQELLTEDERAEMRPAVADCLIEAGVPGLKHDSGLEEILAAMNRGGEPLSDEQYDCVARYRGYFSTWEKDGAGH
jgi:hypothetical protein